MQPKVGNILSRYTIKMKAKFRKQINLKRVLSYLVSWTDAEHFYLPFCKGRAHSTNTFTIRSHQILIALFSKTVNKKREMQQILNIIELDGS